MIFSILEVALVSLTITVGVAFTLVLTQRPKAVEPKGALDFGNQLAQYVSDPAPLLAVRIRDGYALHYRDYPAMRATAPLLVMVHGSGWHGLKFDSAAKALQGKAHLIDPDLHGHGTAPGRRGDVDYIVQFGDNLGDLVATLHQPDQNAAGAYGDMMDSAILLASFLRHDARMTRDHSGGWTPPLVRRIVGLKILNSLRIDALNHLPVIQFDMPRAVLLIAGDRNEVFDASLYAPTMAAVTDRDRYYILSEPTISIW
ncbi:hypothetical protein [uncultured Sulfitobacter sp.]|uniref:alpha/beta hydrolase n=1 Tax=uncultured Sulfitobacter sp. TaxID=191468 RepID=UPI002603BA7F|nr:hypothetical protein [uncultured Sulfitobacter sp.]